MNDHSSCLTLNILSDLATPHNNSLLKVLCSVPNLKINLYYAMSSWADLPWKSNLNDIFVKARIFGHQGVNFRLLWYAISHRHERYLLVGWANPTMRAIILAFWILRRPFMFWSDHPDESRRRSRLNASIRRCFFRMVKDRVSHVFAVGRHAVRYFEERGFERQKLINLPIFIELPDLAEDCCEQCRRVRARYNIQEHEILFVAASRFVYAKGFDLLIRAVAQVHPGILQKLRLLLIGHGPEEPTIRRLIAEFHLEDRVIVESWMEPEMFDRTVASADVFVHPARFDAFGGGTLHAMAAGVPVIGSDGAGAVVERVVHGVNGLIFQKENVSDLAACLVSLLQRPHLIHEMGAKAMETAQEWPPKRGAQILLDHLCRQ